MRRLFGGDTYETPPDAGPLPLARWLGWTRLPFYWYIHVVMRKGRHAAQHGLFDDEAFIARSEEVMRAVEGCGGRVAVTGMNHISDVSGPALVIGNHMSFLETFALPSIVLPRKALSFVIKDSLLRHPGIGPILASQNPILMTRTNPREDLKTIMREGASRLAEGRSVCVFPQSTRSREFVAAKLNSIGAKLAQRSGVPIIPVALRTDFMGNGLLIKDIGPVYPEREVRFAFGEPIDASNAKDAHRQVVEFISSHLSAWGVPCR